MLIQCDVLALTPPRERHRPRYHSRTANARRAGTGCRAPRHTAVSNAGTVTTGPVPAFTAYMHRLLPLFTPFLAAAAVYTCL